MRTMILKIGKIIKINEEDEYEECDNYNNEETDYISWRNKLIGIMVVQSNNFENSLGVLL